jgi:hypothetical protein
MSKPERKHGSERPNLNTKQAAQKISRLRDDVGDMAYRAPSDLEARQRWFLVCGQIGNLLGEIDQLNGQASMSKLKNKVK